MQTSNNNIDDVMLQVYFIENIKTCNCDLHLYVQDHTMLYTTN